MIFELCYSGLNNYEIQWLYFGITIMHGRDKLHHLRTMEFMPIPYPYFTYVSSGNPSCTLLLCVLWSKPWAYRVLGSMEPVVRIEPNNNQALLMFDNARKDLEPNGWLTFVQWFEGFNLAVAR